MYIKNKNVTLKLPEWQWAIGVFLLAAVVRVGYVLTAVALMGADGIMSGDSVNHYLNPSIEFLEKLSSVDFQGWDLLGTKPTVMPVYLWFISLVMALSGSLSPLWPVLLQCIIDSMTCVTIAFITGCFDRRLLAPAGFFAAINPTMIVVSGLLLTDCLFLFTCSLSILCLCNWLRLTTIKSAVMIGMTLGIAALTRVLIVPWAGVVFGFMILAGIWMKSPLRKLLFQATVACLVFSLLIAPLLLRNVVKYDALALTPQTGSYVLYWLVPLTKEVANGIPQAEGAQEMERRYLSVSNVGKGDNPFVRSKEMTEYGLKELRQLGGLAVAKAWGLGAAINVFSPAATMSPLVSTLPRTGFYNTPGKSKGEKIWNFLFKNDNLLYGWILVTGSIGVLVFRTIQIGGVVASIKRGGKQQYAILLILGLWVGFILIVNGPIATPKYRLPLEPVFVVFSAIGFVQLRRRFLASDKTKRLGTL